MSKKFFQEQKGNSKVKTEILIKYFSAWSKIMKGRSRTNRIAYIDLFAGPGIYESGEISTPVQLLSMCIEDDDLSEKMVTIFNDVDEKNIETLEKTLSGLPNIDKLKYPPQFICSEVGEEIEGQFKKMSLVPTLAFIDPFGYKGMTTGLIKALIKDFGSDCIFFFNYNRINMGINNSIVDEHMKALFGHARHEEMKTTIPLLEGEFKELYIVEMLSQAISENGQHHVLPFKFLSEEKNMTSHYLIFVSKHPLGYTIMKDIMAKQSTLFDDGVASFSYIPVKHLGKHQEIQLSILSSYQGKIDELCEKLLFKYKGGTGTLLNLFEADHLGTNYTKSNYKEAIRRLEADGTVIVTPPASDRQKRKGKVTVADGVKITFAN